jgi:hypothetical protein
MAYTFTTLVPALAAALSVDANDADFLALLPTITDDAEQVLYRELGLVACRVTQGGTLAPNTRLFTLPTAGGKFLVLDQLNVLDDSMIRHPVSPSSTELVDLLWPSDSAPGPASRPSLFSRLDDLTLLVGPASDTALTLECRGTFRPEGISSSNPTTFLSTYLSDLFLCGCVVSATGNLLKNWSAMADDPQMPVTWVALFREKLASAQREELRKTYVNAVSAPSSSIRSI